MNASDQAPESSKMDGQRQYMDDQKDEYDDNLRIVSTTYCLMYKCFYHYLYCFDPKFTPA